MACYAYINLVICVEATEQVARELADIVGATRWVAHESLMASFMHVDKQSYSFRRSIRLRGYDYSQAGAYFVTICTYNNACIFGEIRDGDMRQNDLGALVCQEWQRTEEVRNGVALDAFIVMPNHLHGIILMLQVENPKSSPHLLGAHPQQSPTLRAGSLGAIVGQFKSTVTRRANSLNATSNSRVWQRNYYEHVIRSEESLNFIRRYIVENPARWTEDSLYVG